MMNIMQGSKNWLSSVEYTLYDFFNNRHSVHAIDSDFFVKHNPNRGKSDIDIPTNPEMMVETGL